MASALCAAALYPLVEGQLARTRNAAGLARVQNSAHRSGEELTPALSLRVQRLDGLLASWETIGGCGAGTSTGAGGGIKWIGHSTSGGLFQLQELGTYTRIKGGDYILSLNNQISKDLSEKWNFGLSVPLLYKYYHTPFPVITSDFSNSGLGDMSVFLVRRLGEINDTTVTASLGLPTGSDYAGSKGSPFSQEKQLGIGRLTGGVAIDHTLDEIWGTIVLGGSFSYRGGQNKYGNYRGPVGNLYAYSGYFVGPFVPALGLTLNRFFGVDRNLGSDQQENVFTVAGTFSLEWSTDWIAILGAVSLPYGWDVQGQADSGGSNAPLKPGLQPWTVGLGVTVSPF
ncbi:MAG: hypothetical protein ABI488_04275 [Polyangiaceae bacterium]